MLIHSNTHFFCFFCLPLLPLSDLDAVTSPDDAGAFGSRVRSARVGRDLLERRLEEPIIVGAMVKAKIFEL